MSTSDRTPPPVDASQFTALDHGTQNQHATLIRWLDLQNSWATMRAAKRALLDLLVLRPGQAALEVGCGTGDDARVLAERVGPTGRVVALDLSMFQLEEARRRAVGSPLAIEFAQGDVQELAYPDDTFDACRCERVLQHVPALEQAIRELVRVTKPGGRVVVIDTDWGGLVTSDPVTQAITAHVTATIRNPQVGRALGRLFRDAGLREIVVRPQLGGPLPDEWTPEAIQMSQSFIPAALAGGALTPADAAAWSATFAQDVRDGIAFWAAPYFVVAGTKA
jgi:ubiquinone/menaquinone biosynthesis C-methylase UbiE